MLLIPQTRGSGGLGWPKRWGKEVWGLQRGWEAYRGPWVTTEMGKEMQGSLGPQGCRKGVLEVLGYHSTGKGILGDHRERGRGSWGTMDME